MTSKGKMEEKYCACRNGGLWFRCARFAADFFEAGVHAIIGLSFGRHQRALRDAAAHSAADCGDLIR